MVDDHETTSSPVVDHETGNVSDKVEVTQEDRDAADEAVFIKLPEAFARHRLAERAAIVAWLREQDGYGEWYECADQIEAGEHLPKPFTRSDDV